MIPEKLKTIGIKMLQQNKNVPTRKILAEYGKQLVIERKQELSKTKHSLLPLDDGTNDSANSFADRYGLFRVFDLLSEGETWPLIGHYRIWLAVTDEVKAIQDAYRGKAGDDIANIIRYLYPELINRVKPNNNGTQTAKPNAGINYVQINGSKITQEEFNILPAATLKKIEALIRKTVK